MEPIDAMEMIWKRLEQTVLKAVEGLNQRELAWQPGPEANSIGLILWHLARSEDMAFQVDLQKKTQIWDEGKWGEKLGLSVKAQEFGYGYTPDQAAGFPVPPLPSLLEYFQTVTGSHLQYLRSLTPQKLEERIQHRAFGEITVAQQIELTAFHISRHLGQIEYIRGLIRGANK